MITIKFKTGLLLFLLLFAFSCENNTSPEVNEPYISLDVGDLRQYYVEHFDYYIQWEIVGKTNRIDGREVFIGVWHPGFVRQYDTSYYFIDNGYFQSTLLDTTVYEEYRDVNPFIEQKLAKLYPEDGDEWERIVGWELQHDSDNYYVATYLPEKETICKIFSDVFYFHDHAEKSGVFYAKKYGCIGSVSLNEPIAELNYIRIKNYEHGIYHPIDESVSFKTETNYKDMNQIFTGGL